MAFISRRLYCTNAVCVVLHGRCLHCIVLTLYALFCTDAVCIILYWRFLHCIVRTLSALFCNDAVCMVLFWRCLRCFLLTLSALYCTDAVCIILYWRCLYCIVLTLSALYCTDAVCIILYWCCLHCIVLMLSALFLYWCCLHCVWMIAIAYVWLCSLTLYMVDIFKCTEEHVLICGEEGHSLEVYQYAQTSWVIKTEYLSYSGFFCCDTWFCIAPWTMLQHYSRCESLNLTRTLSMGGHVHQPPSNRFSAIPRLHVCHVPCCPRSMMSRSTMTISGSMNLCFISQPFFFTITW